MQHYLCNKYHISFVDITHTPYAGLLFTGTKNIDSSQTRQSATQHHHYSCVTNETLLGENE